MAKHETASPNRAPDSSSTSIPQHTAPPGEGVKRPGEPLALGVTLWGTRVAGGDVHNRPPGTYLPIPQEYDDFGSTTRVAPKIMFAPLKGWSGDPAAPIPFRATRPHWTYRHRHPAHEVLMGAVRHFKRPRPYPAKR